MQPALTWKESQVTRQIRTSKWYKLAHPLQVRNKWTKLWAAVAFLLLLLQRHQFAGVIVLNSGRVRQLGKQTCRLSVSALTQHGGRARVHQPPSLWGRIPQTIRCRLLKTIAWLGYTWLCPSLCHNPGASRSRTIAMSPSLFWDANKKHIHELELHRYFSFEAQQDDDRLDTLLQSSAPGDYQPLWSRSAAFTQHIYTCMYVYTSVRPPLRV